VAGNLSARVESGRSAGSRNWSLSLWTIDVDLIAARLMLRISITGFDADPDAITTVLGIIPSRVRVGIDPDAIATALGLIPSRVRRVGDGGPKPFNGWWFEAHAPQLRSGGDHSRGIAVIKDVLRGREDRFRTVAETYRPDRMTIYGGLHYDSNEQGGVWLDPEDMALISACRLGWGLDLWVDPFGPKESA
jgi:hypothetical protein